ncbi:tagaturonate reductase [Maribacter algarum]|uniref:Tagaturonate reductase n=1 Tax=Maribacter algarum (ex Zhang et al. 2020) TaxID=2578118 RepID=A0A5S3PPX5_9FLAO|nr:tagaturonate reductase [Maribacter algarum]TMM56762.1 tagaturonate reductase [Maribacter algarum]
MQELNRQTTSTPKNLPLKVMQFGGGNFLRAFVDWMVQVLNQETDFKGGVVVIKPTVRGDYQVLKSQDGLFTVVLDGIRNGELVAERTLVDCVQDVINPYSEWDTYLELAKNPEIRFIVSNTTEAGIKFDVADTFEDNPPKEFPAKLTIWLYHRFQHFGNDKTKGCILLPCELIEDNGTTLKSVILKYAEHWNLERDFVNWIYTANHFCDTLVDRIVSGYPNDRAEEIRSEMGYEDALLVAGEYYHSWVIRGPELVQNELPFKLTDLNVEFVKDLVSYREMKVRILNGAHTAMVPVGYLGGLRLVNEVMDDTVVCDFVESLLMNEVAKTLDFPDRVLNKFVQDVLDRFRNPLLKHQLISISLNSTSKFFARLLPTLTDYYVTQGSLPKRIVFGLSALICFYKGEFGGKRINLKDDPKVLNFFASNWKEYESNKLKINILVGIILSNTSIWGKDLTRFEGLVETVSENIISIEDNGVLATLKKL